MQKYECNLEEIIEKLQASDSKYEIAEKEFLDKDDDVSTFEIMFFSSSTNHLACIHSKSEKVCGTAFSVKKNCGKSA